MSIRIGINGFGRIGRLALRAGWGSPELEFVHVNEVQGGPEVAAHLTVFDSVHGRWNHEVASRDGIIVVDGTPVTYSAQTTPGSVPWKERGVDVVLECSGKFRTPSLLAPYRAQGVKKVVVADRLAELANRVYDAPRELVFAVWTNCLAPVVKVVHEGIGIKHGVITTIHDATNTQVVVDAPHKDLRRARAAGLSLIPTSTGSATAIALIASPSRFTPGQSG